MQVAKGALKYIKTKCRYDSQHNQFVLVFKCMDKMFIEETAKLAKACEVKELKGKFFITQKPQDSISKYTGVEQSYEKEERTAKLDLDITCAFNRELINVAASGFDLAPGLRFVFGLLNSAHGASVSVKFDDLHDFYKQFIVEKDVDEIFAFNWSTIRWSMEEILVEEFDSSKTKRLPVVNCYKSFLDNLTGISQMSVFLPDNSRLVVRFDNPHLFAVAPSMADLQRKKKAKEEKKTNQQQHHQQHHQHGHQHHHQKQVIVVKQSQIRKIRNLILWLWVMER